MIDCVLFSFMKAKKKGIDAPFPYWEVKKFCPQFAQVCQVTSEQNAEEHSKKKASQNLRLLCVDVVSDCCIQADKRLDMVQWSASFQNFALAASAVGFWQYHLAMAHHGNCLKVACKSSVTLHVSIFTNSCDLQCLCRSREQPWKTPPACAGLRRGVQEGVG